MMGVSFLLMWRAMRRPKDPTNASISIHELSCTKLLIGGVNMNRAAMIVVRVSCIPRRL